MMRLLLASCVLLLVGLAVWPTAQEKKDEDVPVQRVVECRWAPRAISIDGRLKKSWEGAQEIKDFVVFWQKRKAKTATTARLLWDNRHLYFLAEMEDSDLYATVKEKNGQTWYDDVFELFFKPVAEGKGSLHYYEFQVNALNTQLELFMPSRGSGGYQRFAPDTNLGMESVVRLDGTLNNWKDKDKGWTVEGRIPWTAFAATGGRPEPGTRWRFALCRYDYSAAFDQPELSSTAPLPVANFHQYENYGELLFVGPE
jgi:Carbohydrate family 9 binding domain-like